MRRIPETRPRPEAIPAHEVAPDRFEEIREAEAAGCG
jgi:hypothetical protein